ncbi:unnamed protein product [Caenorhabditis auriculariae]|uniref:Uncharacterized protein n=1 Tax=Caenorhabditis auriculariae TaxID=2777116 RepID=A0A8S1GQ68_9PELO|nr:unnamed protein product [Caenorhabditis auriculariae]
MLDELRQAEGQLPSDFGDEASVCRKDVDVVQLELDVAVAPTNLAFIVLTTSHLPLYFWAYGIFFQRLAPYCLPSESHYY